MESEPARDWHNSTGDPLSDTSSPIYWAHGALPLLAWGRMGQSVAFGATIPGEGYSTAVVLTREIVTTFALITTLCIVFGFRHLRGYTPLVIPFLYAVGPLEAHMSGTSTLGFHMKDAASPRGTGRLWTIERNGFIDRRAA